MNRARREEIRRKVDEVKRQRLTRSKMTRDDQLDQAAYALFRAAGRPDAMWDGLSDYEREAWRVCVRVTVAAYIGEMDAA